jgi:hypothetical protein
MAWAISADSAASKAILWLAFAWLLAGCVHNRSEPIRDATPLERVRIADDGKTFVLATSGKRFVPWGFNYDHDASPEERLLEDYWQSEWPSVEAAFREMKRLGATVVRIHLQLAKFMRQQDEPDRDALARLGNLLQLGESTGLRIELVGLGSYRSADTPPWYDALDESARWAVQARFWEAVAAEGTRSSAVFSYELMNEPVVPGETRESWLAPAWDNGRTYVEFLARKPEGRSRSEIGRSWLRMMTAAIRRHDREHLITVGLFAPDDHAAHLPIGLTPKELAKEVDYLSIHIYPKEGALEEALHLLDELSIGKPVVVEETAPLRCSVVSLRQFLESGRPRFAGAMSFFWGKTTDAYRGSNQLRDTLMLDSLELFRSLAPPSSR